MDFETQLRGEFNTLMKKGSSSVYNLMDEIEGYIKDTESPTILEKRIQAIITIVRSDKKLSFTQFKELYPFLLSERKLKEAMMDKDEYIILD